MVCQKLSSTGKTEAYAKQSGKGIEEPPMAINFLLVLLLQAEKNLSRYNPFIRILEMQMLVQAKRRGIFE